MLKVIDDGVLITLNGTPKNTLYWFSLGLLALAVVVAVVAMVAPVQITIGFMAVFAVGFMVFPFRFSVSGFSCGLGDGFLLGVVSTLSVQDGRKRHLEQKADSR